MFGQSITEWSVRTAAGQMVVDDKQVVTYDNRAMRRGLLRRRRCVGMAIPFHHASVGLAFMHT